MGKELLLAALVWFQEKFQEDIAIVVNTDNGRIDSVFHLDPTYDISSYSTLRTFPNKAIIPGLINCHSHAFQRGLRGLGEEFPKSNGNEHHGSFWTWRKSMYKLVETLNEKEFFHLAKKCFSEMRRNGITSVGEFHYFHHSQSSNDYAMDELILQAAKEVGIRIVLLNAFYNSSGFNQEVNHSQKRFYTESIAQYMKNIKRLQNVIKRMSDEKRNRDMLKLGIVAHSIRAVNIADIKELYNISIADRMVFHMHLEEQMKEIRDCKAYYDGQTPMRLILNECNTDLSNFTAIHCTHTCTTDMVEFIERGGKVCICPSTEGNLGDGICKLSEVKSDLNLQLCVGSDCNERIDLFEELRWLEYGQRLANQERGSLSNIMNEVNQSNLLFKIGTIYGANSLSLECGEISVGKYADFICIDLDAQSLNGCTNDSLMGGIIFGSCAFEIVTDSCIGGQWENYKDTRALSRAKSKL